MVVPSQPVEVELTRDECRAALGKPLVVPLLKVLWPVIATLLAAAVWTSVFRGWVLWSAVINVAFLLLILVFAPVAVWERT